MQAHILRVEFGQRLVLLHPLAHLDQALADLAADAESQLRLMAGTYLAGIGLGDIPRGNGLHDHGRTNGRLGLFAVAAGCQG
ncbi:hypothetical protein D3C81_1440540 [compost metagenome]